MSNSLKREILEVLREIESPDGLVDLISLGMVKDVQLDDFGEVVFAIEVDPAKGAALEPLRQRAEDAVARVKGVQKVTAILTAERKAEAGAKQKSTDVQVNVRHIIAVASGKGGVGKSMIANVLAVNLSNNGQKVGLLDADIYGPSQPRMMGVSGQKPQGVRVKGVDKIAPLEAYGVKVMSIGLMVDEAKALVWRGPMVQSAFLQLIRDVHWAEEDDPLDFLIIDMPPGTGDVQLTLAQKVPLAGAVIVSTPQDIALLDARKGIEMFGAVDVPILGLVENMSTHICSACGHEEHIFGHGGARKEAENLGVPFLGEVPLSLDIRKAGDEGKPVEVSVFDDMAKALISSLA